MSNKPRNTTEKLLSKFTESIVINRSSIGEISLKDMLQILNLNCKLIEDEIQRRSV